MATPQKTPPPLERHLDQLASEIARSCPDLRDRVRQLAIAFLTHHGLGKLEPEQVYWHRFTDAVSSHTAFSGWAHYQRPVESLTLVQLVMQRFSTNDQDAPDQLDMMTGFYHVNADGPRFDESTEVRLLPSELMHWLWATDLKTTLLADIEAFWQHHETDFRLLGKAHFMSLVLEERQAGTLTDQDLRFLFNAVAGGVTAPLTLDALAKNCAPPPDARVYVLQIGDYQATDILCVESPSGEHFMWVPGQTQGLHKFDSLKAMHLWLLMENNDAHGLSRFLLHFPLQASQGEPAKGGITHAIDLLYFTWGQKEGSRLLYQPEQRLGEDAFGYLTRKAHARMVADAKLALQSNAQERKKLWLGYLGAFNQAFGPMAALDWPVALAMVGAGLADLGLNVDQAVNAPTSTERQAGVQGAIVASVNLLFNSLYLWGAWAGEPAGGTVESPVQAPRPAPEPIALPTLEQVQREVPEAVEVHDLDNLEANVLLERYSPGAEGISKGVYTLPNGEHYVSISGLPYRVRYASDLGTWVVVDPDNPFAFTPRVPLRPTADGGWAVLPRIGLSGGGKLDDFLGWIGRPRVQVSPVAPTAYDLPPRFGDELRKIMLDPNDRTLQGYVDLSQGSSGIQPAFSEARERLITDATAFFRHPALQAHPTIPAQSLSTVPKQVIRALFESSDGLVVGEAHSQIAGKQLLIEHMPRFAKAGVDTLYMEHLLTDAHQLDLDTFLTTGKMPPSLKSYLQSLDAGHMTDPSGRYTFLEVVKAAAKSRIRIRALDCAVSYRDVPRLDMADTGRQQFLSYYGHQIIGAPPQASKWIAFVGNSHTDNYLGVPGLADLEGAVSLRVEDVPMSETGGFSADPGIVISRGSRPGVLIKSDLRLRVPVADGRVSANIRTPEALLKRPGNYVVVYSRERLEIIHRSRTGELALTPIIKEGATYRVERPKWRHISGIRFSSLDLLLSGLDHGLGLRRVT